MNKRPFFVIFIFFLLGVVISKNTAFFPFILIFILLSLCLFAVTFFLKKKFITRFLWLVLFFIFLGWVYGFVRDFNAFSKTNDLKSDMVLTRGMITSEVMTKNHFNRIKKTFYFRPDNKIEEILGVQPNKLLVNLYLEKNQGLELNFGAYLEVEGKVYKPFDIDQKGKFSYIKYLVNNDVYFIMSISDISKIKVIRSKRQWNFLSYIYLLKKHLLSKLDLGFNHNEAGILKALLLGDRTDVPRHVKLLYEKTGTAHILAISGLHLSIFVSSCFFVLKFFFSGRKRNILILNMIILGFVLVVGFKVSVIRASVMVFLFLFALLIEREADFLNILGFTGLVILIFNPNLLFDVGFQLSFLSVFFIIVLYKRNQLFLNIKCADVNLTRDRNCDKESGINRPNNIFKAIINMMFVSFSAWIGVMGLVLYYFNIITPISLIANLIAVPLTSMLVILGYSYLLFSFLLPILSSSLIILIRLLMNLKVYLLYLLSKIPNGCLYIRDVCYWQIIIYYLFIFSIFFIRWDKILSKIYGFIVSFRIYYEKLTKNI